MDGCSIEQQSSGCPRDGFLTYGSKSSSSSLQPTRRCEAAVGGDPALSGPSLNMVAVAISDDVATLSVSSPSIGRSRGRKRRFRSIDDCDDLDGVPVGRRTTSFQINVTYLQRLCTMWRANRDGGGMETVTGSYIRGPIGGTGPPPEEEREEVDDEEEETSRLLTWLQTQIPQQLEAFLHAVFSLLCRYDALFGPGESEGRGLQCSVPKVVLDVLRTKLAVTCECFASPLNAYCPEYFSIFPDTDCPFGSRGSFFDKDVNLYRGSFEVNPPFDERIMERVVGRLLGWLSNSSQPLSFSVVVPFWDNGPCKYLTTLCSNRFNRASITLAKGNHAYLNGFQHRCTTTSLRFPSVCSTHFVLLQNDSGTEAWPATEELSRAIREAWEASLIT